MFPCNRSYRQTLRVIQNHRNHLKSTAPLHTAALKSRKSKKKIALFSKKISKLIPIAKTFRKSMTFPSVPTSRTTFLPHQKNE